MQPFFSDAQQRNFLPHGDMHFGGGVFEHDVEVPLPDPQFSGSFAPPPFGTGFVAPHPSAPAPFFCQMRMPTAGASARGLNVGAPSFEPGKAFAASSVPGSKLGSSSAPVRGEELPGAPTPAFEEEQEQQHDHSAPTLKSFANSRDESRAVEDPRSKEEPRGLTGGPRSPAAGQGHTKEPDGTTSSDKRRSSLVDQIMAPPSRPAERTFNTAGVVPNPFGTTAMPKGFGTTPPASYQQTTTPATSSHHHQQPDSSSQQRGLVVSQQQHQEASGLLGPGTVEHVPGPPTHVAGFHPATSGSAPPRGAAPFRIIPTVNPNREAAAPLVLHTPFRSNVPSTTSSGARPHHADHIDFADVALNPRAEVVKAIQKKNAEYETEVHFQKCYNVMAEIWEHFGDELPEDGFRFLDFGCAPGGFSCFLLEDSRCRFGLGVSLASGSGGYPIRLRKPNFMIQVRYSSLAELAMLMRMFLHCYEEDER